MLVSIERWSLALVIATFLAPCALAQDAFALPGETVYPEGIAVDPTDRVLYVGSTADGTIYRADLETGLVDVFVGGGGEHGMASVVGLALDARGTLWVAGGTTGAVVALPTSGDLSARTFTTPSSDATFINDLVVGRSGDVYVTDSFRPALFRISSETAPGVDGALEPWLDFTGTDLTYRDGFNANGIVVDQDETFLVVVQSNTGHLFRVDINTRDVNRIPVLEGMHPMRVQNGDGLVLEGDTLYVVRNANREIVVLELSRDGREATYVDTIESDSFDFPTTAALHDGMLFVVNSQLDPQADGEPNLPFTVLRIPAR